MRLFASDGSMPTCIVHNQLNSIGYFYGAAAAGALATPRAMNRKLVADDD
jgi:hypothetical protein